ncbi:hypothetical protein GSF04_08220 [Pseudoalteromonas sp. A22]|uniref:hypothetical protein n=1 Tax=Pseudoalteromonas sp. A22 TaxID=327511 RepID=UPI001BAC88F2|nr:hypothetical protein [Pseudoalteromonas sp. A22]QUI62501.1 hypothetical protein GSF04_08220 [Pseudoalteromonas sp. A22]
MKLSELVTAALKPKTIKDINNKYDYKDEYPQGEGDSDNVACGQDGSYNELQYIYNTYLKPEVTSGNITEKDAIEALDSACSSLNNPRKREDFYSHLEDKLGIQIP